jgi:hypothetical protein
VAPISDRIEAPGTCAAGVNIQQDWTAGSLGCVMILPVSDGIASGATSSDPILHIQATAAFYVWCNKSSSGGTNCQEWVGQLIGPEAFVGNLLTSVVLTSNNAPGVPVMLHLTQ